MKQFDSEPTNMLFAITKRLALKKQTLVLFFSVFLTLAGFAQNRYAVASGNWNDINTWSASPGGVAGASVPTAANNVVIETGHTVTLNRAEQALDLLVSSGAALNAGAFNLTIFGDWTNSGTFAAGTGTVIFSKNTGTQSLIAGTSSFYNLTHNQNAILLLNSSDLVVSNNFLNSLGVFNPNGLNVTATASFTLSGGSFSGGSGNLNIGNFVLNGATANMIAPSGAFNVSGNWTRSNGTFTPGTNTVNFNGNAAAQNINSATIPFFNVIHSGSSLFILNGSGMVTNGTFINEAGAGDFNMNTGSHSVAGLTTINGGNYIVNGAQNFGGGVTINAGGTLTHATNTALNVRGNWTNNGGTFTPGTFTVTINGSVAQTIGGSSPTTFNNLTITNTASAVATLAADVTVSALLTVSASANLNLATQNLYLAGATPNLTGTFNTATSTVFYTNAGTIGIAATNYHNLNLTGGLRTNAGTIGIRNVLTPGAVTTLGGTVAFNGSLNQNIPALTYSNLQTATGGIKTLVGNTTVTSVLTVNAGSTIDLGSAILTLNGTPTPLVVAGNFVANTSTVIFSVNNPQTIPALTYYNLQTGGNNNKSLGGPVTVTNTLNIVAGTTLIVGANTLTLSGAGSPIIGGGSFNIGTSSTIVYNGTAAQIIPTAYIFNNLTINNISGVTLSTSPTVNGILTFNNGRINTGVNTLILGNAANITGAGPGQYVNGNLRKGIAAATTSKNFEVGDNNYYTPVALTFAGTTNATGNITASTTGNDHPQIGNSEINPSLTANRFWTLTNSGVTGFTSFNATFNYSSADLDGGAVPNSFIVNRFVPSTWFTPAPVINGATSTQANGLAATEFGDFQLGQAAAVVEPCGFNANVSSGINFIPCINNITLVNGSDSIVSNSFSANQYFTLDVIRGMIYQVYTSNVTNPASPLTISIYDEAFPANAPIAFSASNTGNGVTGANNVFVSFTSPISGRLRVLINKRRDCASTLPNGLFVRARIIGGSNTQDDQLIAGTDSWIGHVYDGRNTAIPFNGNFTNYVGYTTQAESFDQNFGGDNVCNSISSDGNIRGRILSDEFAIRYRMNSTKRGLYIADIASDDGTRLAVDGIQVYTYNTAYNTGQGYTTRPRILFGLSGSSNLVLDYYEGGVGNRVSFQNLTLVFQNNLSTNINQTICQGSAVATISGDVFGSLPAGITAPAYQWTYSTTPAGPRTIISGATAASFTPNTSIAPFNVAATYYIYRNATLRSANNVSPNPYNATNESNAATLVVEASAPLQSIVINPTSLCYNNATLITLSSSTIGINYQLRNNATNLPIGAVLAGTGSALNFNTGNILTTTTYNVLAINPVSGCTIQMLNTNTVTINPGTEKTVTATPALVCVGNSAIVTIGLSQPNVKYVLRNDADNSSLGDTLTGNGGDLDFNIPIGYLVSTTVFNVWAIDTVTSCAGVLINKVTIATQNFPSPVFSIEQDFCTLGQGRVILATTDSTFSNFLWSNGDLTPSIVIEQSGFYSLTVTDENGCRTTNSINIGDEKVINGDFSQGVGVGYTTGYILNQAPNGLVSPGIGYYAINTNANFTHGNFWGRDHTSQSGNFMIINGDGPARTIWQTTVNVVPNTRYYFSAWAMSVNNAGPFAQLQFNINGVNSGTSPVLLPGVNNNSNSGWQRFFGTWDSEALSGSIVIRIVNLQGASGGNDFGIDDISFSTLPPVTFFGASVGNGGNNLCLNDTLKLTATLTGGANPITYSWTGPNGFSSSDEDPVILNAEGGWYYLTAVEGRNCQSTDSIFIILSDPNITSIAQPGKCQDQVRITVSGMVPNSINNSIYYTVNNGALRTAFNVNSDALGNATFTPTPALVSGNSGQILRVTGIFNGSCTRNFAPALQVTLDIKTAAAGWIGGTTGNWNDPANWCPGIPLTNTNVLIPTGTTVYVEDNEIANAAGLNLVGTAILELRNGATFNFYGAFSGTGKIDARRGIVTTRRNGNQDLSGDHFVEKSVSTLMLANVSGSGNVTVIGDTLKILSALEFGNVDADLNTGNRIVLVSSDTATARIGVIPGTGNTITGNFIIERYLSNARKWRLLSAPTNRVGQTVRNSWQENGVNLPGYGFNAADPRYTPTNTFGFDFAGNNSSVKRYNPLTENWDAVANTDVLPISNERGYFVFVAGDRTVTFPGSKPTKLRTVGTINRGTLPNITIPANQFAPVGNPYPSRIDMRNINKSAQIANIYYVWDPSLGSFYGLGAFNTFFFDGTDYVNLLASTLYGPAFTPNNFIESGMAVMVRNNSTSSSGTISFEENDKIAGSNMSSFTSNAAHRLVANLKLAPQGSNPAILLDGAGAIFNESYSNDFTEDDVKKLGTVGESVSWKTANNETVIDNRFTPSFNDTLHLQIKQMRVQNYQWEISFDNMDYPGLEAVLIDRYRNTRTALNMNGTTIVNFNIQNIPGSYAVDRFKINFSPSVALPVTFTNIAAQRNTDRSVSVQWKVENEINMDGYVVERSTNGSNFESISGTIAPTNNNAGAAAYQYADLDKVSSDLFYRIKGISSNGEIQYSAIAKVGGFKTDALITVYPNPVQNKQMNVQFSAPIAGNYILTLLSNNGSRIKQQVLKLNNNTSTQTIELPSTLAAGRYQLQIQTPEGKMQQQSVIIL